MKCPYCCDFLNLCPPKRNLATNLWNYLVGSKHLLAVEDARTLQSKSTGLQTGRRGRPSRSFSTSAHSNQPDLHSWFSGALGGSNGGMYSNSSPDANFLKSLMCWGYQAFHHTYNGFRYVVRGLLGDSISGLVWFSEPHLAASIIVGGEAIEISGAFQHRECVRFYTNGIGFLNLTCSMWIQIP